MKILVADDQENMRLMLQDLLTQMGHEVLGAEDGFEALEIFKANGDIELVITDLEMPELDGFELIENVKKIASQVRIIINSSRMLESNNAQKARVLGAERAVTKTELVDLIKNREIENPPNKT